MSLEHLWAGWRAAYVESTVTHDPMLSVGCLYCALPDEPDPSGLLAADERVFAVLNAYPYTSGHLMVVPRRHVADLADLDETEAIALMAMMRHAAIAVRAAFTPDGLNVGMNLGRAAGAGIPGHLHVHVVPRWSGDTNFMTTVAGTRVLPEPLTLTAEKVRAAWPN